MARENNLDDFLLDIANAIREVSGKTEMINAQYFSTAIRELGNLSGNGNISFPYYVKSNEGKGTWRIIPSSQTTLYLINYFDKNASHPSDPITFDLMFEPGQLFFDEFEVLYISKHPRNSYYEVFIGDNRWYITLEVDGSGYIELDD